MRTPVLAAIAVVYLAALPIAQTPEPARRIDTAAVLRFADAFLPAEIARRRIFMVGFPLAFVGRVAGGMPAFVYGVPAPARVLLLIPPVTALLTLAAAVVAIRGSRRARAPLAELVGDWLVVIALMSFIAFAGWWHVLDGGF
jgi:hypothetical protein